MRRVEPLLLRPCGDAPDVDGSGSASVDIGAALSEWVIGRKLAEARLKGAARGQKKSHNAATDHQVNAAATMGGGEQI